MSSGALCPVPLPAASFTVSVAHIVLLSTKIQMARIYAYNIIACVQDAKSRGDRGRKQLPSHPSGDSCFIPNTYIRTSCALIDSSAPKPTHFSYSNFRQENFLRYHASASSFVNQKWIPGAHSTRTSSHHSCAVTVSPTTYLTARDSSMSVLDM